MQAFLINLIRRILGTSELFRQVSSLEAKVAHLTEALSVENGLQKLRLHPADRDAIIHQVNYTNQNLYLHLKEAMRVRELYYRDIMLAVDRLASVYPRTQFVFETERPVAEDSDDHRFPWGAAHDNTRSPRFVRACEHHFPGQRLLFMDLGCSGGGLVLDFILRGHDAWGIEGSDIPLRAQRAEWRVLPQNLFTADITRPFRLRPAADAPPAACHVISAWEVLEHIGQDDLPAVFTNVLTHLARDGIFVGSVALVADDHPNGARYHRTVRPREWWANRFAEFGLPFWDGHSFAFEDFCRGTGNGPIDENYRDQPHIGFHFVARRG